MKTNETEIKIGTKVKVDGFRGVWTVQEIDLDDNSFGVMKTVIDQFTGLMEDDFLSVSYDEYFEIVK